MKNNLSVQLEWLQQNLKEARLSGFTYGPLMTANSKANEKPRFYSFETPKQLAERSAAIVTLSECATVDLDVFRGRKSAEASPLRHPQVRSMPAPVKATSTAAPTSSSSSEAFQNTGNYGGGGGASKYPDPNPSGNYSRSLPSSSYNNAVPHAAPLPEPESLDDAALNQLMDAIAPQEVRPATRSGAQYSGSQSRVQNPVQSQNGAKARVLREELKDLKAQISVLEDGGPTRRQELKTARARRNAIEEELEECEEEEESIATPAAAACQPHTGSYGSIGSNTNFSGRPSYPPAGVQQPVRYDYDSGANYDHENNGNNSAAYSSGGANNTHNTGGVNYGSYSNMNSSSSSSSNSSGGVGQVDYSSNKDQYTQNNAGAGPSWTAPRDNSIAAAWGKTGATTTSTAVAATAPVAAADNDNLDMYAAAEQVDTGGSHMTRYRADTKDPKEEIRTVFGHRRGFRHGQWECIDAALQGRDVFCLMPTGGGKSIVYQLPAWCCPGLVVVFSPLLSLIQDQCDAMTAIGIKAVFMTSVQSESEIRGLYSELFRRQAGGGTGFGGGADDESGAVKMLYITPEKFAKSPAMKSLLHSLYDKGLLSRFVIDEAHCLSQWGHDFRPDYLSLANMRVEYPRVPIMALTATANQRVVQDSMSIMGMRQPFLHTQSFNRPNLHYFVKKKGPKTIKEIADYIRTRKRSEQSGIVYCFSKAETEKCAQQLQAELPSMKNQITFYHADVRPEQKEMRQKQWSAGVVKVICATIAFGMGINKPDVRYVVHYTLPKSLTNYYQESGRAGRDGLKAECILYFSFADKMKVASLIVKGSQGRHQKSSSVQQAMDNLGTCVSYCMDEQQCRRVLLLKYFGEDFPAAQCRNTCDTCAAACNLDLVDYSADAVRVVKLLRLIMGDGGGSRYRQSNTSTPTLVQMTKIYAGSKDKDCSKHLHLRATALTGPDGRLAKVPSTTVIAKLLQTMILQEVLVEDRHDNYNGFSSFHLQPGVKADALLRGTEKLLLAMPKKGVAGAVAAEQEDIDDEFAALMEPVARGGKKTAKGKAKATPKGKGAAGKRAPRSQASSYVEDPEEVDYSDEDGEMQVREMIAKRKSRKSLTLSKPSRATPKRTPAMLVDHFDLVSPSEVSTTRAQGQAQIATYIDDDSDYYSDAGGGESVSRKRAVCEVELEDSEADELFATADSEGGGVGFVAHSIGGPNKTAKTDKLPFKDKCRLRDWLFKYREKWDNYWNYLSNEAIVEISEKVPTSTEELAEISGIGRSRVRKENYGAALLATLYAFLERHDLLHIFPNMPVPTIPHCVSWADPESEAAVKFRNDLIIERTMASNRVQEQLALQKQQFQQQSHGGSSSIADSFNRALPNHNPNPTAPVHRSVPDAADASWSTPAVSAVPTKVLSPVDSNVGAAVDATASSTGAAGVPAKEPKRPVRPGGSAPAAAGVVNPPTAPTQWKTLKHPITAPVRKPQGPPPANGGALNFML